MNESLIEENKANLLAEQKRIRTILNMEGQRDGKGEFPGEFKPNFPQMGDEADENALEVELYDTNLGIKRDLEDKLKKIDAALERIKIGAYGKCLQGDQIEEERLKAIPEAETCIKHSNA